MTIVDESLSGVRIRSFTIESLKERLSVREIIRARIWQEVHDYNALQRGGSFEGLVQPATVKVQPNDSSGGKHEPIDWEKSFATALRAFASNGFFILIGDQQAASLEEEFDVEPETEISFVKLVPLVGG